MAESPYFSELRNKIDSWDLEAEEMLLRKIKTFTDNYIDEFNQFSKNMDNLNLNLLTTEVENYKAYSQLKILSNNQFIEEILDKTEIEPEEPKEEINNPETNKDIVIDDIEKRKNAINISLKNLEEIQKKKEKDKEQIEDDTVSVSSSKLNMDNFSKYIRMPYIIGTGDFQKDKTIGLTLEKWEESEEDINNKKDENDIDADVQEFISDIPIDEKMKAKWEKVKKKKKEQKEKEKEKERLKESEKQLEGNYEFEEEVKPKEPKETESGFLIVEDNYIKDLKKDEYIPPPPPPPPAPPVPPVPIQNVNPDKNGVNDNNVNNNENNNINNQQNNNIIIQPKVENNNGNQNPNPVREEPKKIFNDVKLDSFLAGADFKEDEEEDMDDGLFTRKNRKVPVIPVQMPNQNPNPTQINNNPYQSQMLPMQRNPQMNLNNNLNPNPIHNSNLGLAGKKLKNMFNAFGDDSDDDDNYGIKPPNDNEKKDENPPPNDIFKNEEIKEEKKEEIKEEKKEEIKEDKKEDEEKKEVEDEKIEENKINFNPKKKKTLIIANDGEENKLEKKQSSKDKMFNSLFDLPEGVETDKNEQKKEPEPAQKANNEQKKSQKRLAFLFDDDD